MAISSFERACRAADKNKKAAERAAKATKKNSADGNGMNGKPVLLVDPGELPAVAEKLRNILVGSGTLFDRGVPVRIVNPADGGLPIATPLTSHGVVRAAHQVCRPQKNGENTTLPDRVAGLYLDMTGEWNLPPLVGITSAPLLSDDGNIRAAVGYDRDACVFCCNIPNLSVPDKPTQQQAQSALAALRHAFRTFPFADATRIYDDELR